MKELPLELRIALENLLVDVAAANTIERFLILKQRAIDLKKSIETAYEAQS